MQINRELLEAIAQMGGYHESDRQGLAAGNIGLAPQVNLRFFSYFCLDVCLNFGVSFCSVGVFFINLAH